jgi:uncharacterized protein YndB with AHSA1/START domain
MTSERTATMNSDSDTRHSVVIERTLDAPVDLVWRMWTDPTHFAAWYGPKGATVPVAEMNVRVGGRRRVCMEMATPGGTRQMWFVGEYRDVVENRRLTYTESMSDEDGNLVSPSEMGMPEGAPDTTEIMVELTALGDGRTGMVLTHTGVPAGSPGEAGWNMALDKLIARLEAEI